MQPPSETSHGRFLLPIRDLESNLLKLTPFIPSKHAQDLFDVLKAEPELEAFLPYGPFDSVQCLLDKFIIGRIGNSNDQFLFAIFDKKDGQERMAGVVGLLNTLAEHASTEIGFITIFRAFQRSHVSTHAIGLLLHYLLELPDSKSSPYGPGIGLRRVQWQAHADNKPSVRAAERMGFKLEGIMRWQRVLPIRKRGYDVPTERAGGDRKGRHSAVLALCWDDWELEGARELVRKQMERTNVSA